jgi:hypothetical protein
MPNLDPWINQYDDENDQITEEAYSKYENYLLSVRAKFQRKLEKKLPDEYPNYVESYQKTIEMIDWTLIRYRMILPIENN